MRRKEPLYGKMRKRKQRAQARCNVPDASKGLQTLRLSSYLGGEAEPGG